MLYRAPSLEHGPGEGDQAPQNNYCSLKGETCHCLTAPHSLPGAAITALLDTHVVPLPWHPTTSGSDVSGEIQNQWLHPSYPIHADTTPGSLHNTFSLWPQQHPAARQKENILRVTLCLLLPITLVLAGREYIPVFYPD